MNKQFYSKDLGFVRNDVGLLRKAAKNVFFNGSAIKGGRGLKWCVNNEKTFLLFVAVKRFNIFCLRRHIQISILVYTLYTPL